jgi:soluble lytic murein transglycosylase-like protein
MGLMQIIPATAARYGVTSRLALLDPEVNVDVGTRYLRDLQKMFPGRIDLMLASYNAGEGAVARHGNRIPPYPETQSYVRQIMALAGASTTGPVALR